MLRHSPLFWLGFFPIVVILWAWADSQRFQTKWITKQGADRATALEISRSALQLRKDHATRMSEAEVGTSMHKIYEHVPPFGPIGTFGVIERHPYVSKKIVIPWFPAPAKTDEKQVSSVWRFTITIFRVPFWLLLAGFLPLWLPLSWWQARRRSAKPATR